jgi:hypothetical protein
MSNGPCRLTDGGGHGRGEAYVRFETATGAIASGLGTMSLFLCRAKE